jgi:hypothetical protein
MNHRHDAMSATWAPGQFWETRNDEQAHDPNAWTPASPPLWDEHQEYRRRQDMESAPKCSADQLQKGAEREHQESVKLVPELRAHFATKLQDDVLQGVVGDLHVPKGVSGLTSLEHDVRGGQHLQHDPRLVQGLPVEGHGLQCSEAGIYKPAHGGYPDPHWSVS